MKVSICGCGWLGLPLATHLVNKGMDVWGSKQDEAAADSLNDLGINGIQLSLPDDVIEPKSGPQWQQFFGSDVLVINVAPGRGEYADKRFIASVLGLAKQAKLAGCHRIVFISTTGVYGSAKGIITEDTPVQPETASAKAHVFIEQQLLSQWGENVVIIRLAGLIGPKRHPVKFLSNRQGIEHGLDKVNLIHQEDCINAITEIMTVWPKKQILHLAAPTHPTRQAYYTAMADLIGIPAPCFSASKERDAKVVDASETCEQLSLTLKYPDLMVLKPQI
ncbi:protein yeeZ precursor [Photobacterium sanctipauli]|uniref:Protein yeeZ n=1 Tax=Photobacterium sanctipauli TaxID=1342794 RepID=A0A2T3NXU0_9GAMM|nr:NAD-dependent epimerase/dehydratase family protein [Photobacterium sanctipauli]PSW21104.1 protein yeeZ precursor [Photobacterium sanctipauli]